MTVNQQQPIKECIVCSVSSVPRVDVPAAAKAAPAASTSKACPFCCPSWMMRCALKDLLCPYDLPIAHAV